jgi:subtilisin family serine protease
MMSPLRRTAFPLLALCIAALAVPSIASASDVIVRFKPGTDAADRADARRAAAVVREEILPVSGMEVVDPGPGISAAEAIADLQRSQDVLYAQADSRRELARTADDAFFGSQWGLGKIAAPTAWDTTVGSAGVGVAVVDTGLDLAHPDLAPNVWRNVGETARDGRDEDGNGYADDLNGWDFAAATAGDGVGDGDPSDEPPLDPTATDGHGTHVAGTVGAQGGDTVGVAGVAWDAAIMALRVFDSAGATYTSDLVKAFAYAQANGARILNASLSGTGFDQAEYDAIRAARDVLFVVAAGNAGRDNDVTPAYPCAYDLPNIVCVAATNDADALATFSNYGRQTVDIAAPGDRILSARPDGRWQSLSGTSMAAPHAAGAAVLVLDQRPRLTPWQVREVLVRSADPVDGLAARTVAGGRLNADAVLDEPAPPASLQPAGTDPTPAPAIEPVAAITPSPTPTPSPAPTPAPQVPYSAAPGTVPLVAPALDRRAPGLTVALARRGRLRDALAGRLRIRTTVSERSAVRLTLRLDDRTARRLRVSAPVGSGRAAIARAGTASVNVRLSGRAKRALRRARSITVTVRVTATDAAGNRTTRSRRLTLR